MFRLNPGNNAVVPGDLHTQWTVETGGPISASPTVAGDLLYIGNNIGRFSAIDLKRGSVRWTRQFPNPLMAAALVIDDLVVVGEGNENSDVHHGMVHVGSGENAMIAFDRFTGKVRWKVPLTGTAMPTPALVNGKLYVHDGSGTLTEIDPVSGTIGYARNVGTVPSMVAVLPMPDDSIVTGGQTETGIYRIRASDAAIVWKHAMPTASGVGDCPIASDGKALFSDYLAPTPPAPYVKAGDPNEERALALNAADGSVRWDLHLEEGVVPLRNQSAIPMLDGDRVFIGSSIVSAMHSIDKTHGKLDWRRAVLGPVKGASVAVDGTIYFGDLAGYLWALDERTGKIEGVLKTPTPFNVGSPIVVGRTLIIGSLTGRVAAIPLDRIRNGRDLSSYPKRVAQWLPADAQNAFDAADQNHDGVIEWTEFEDRTGDANRREERAEFASLDRDDDGMVTPLEYRTALEAGRSAAREIDR